MDALSFIKWREIEKWKAETSKKLTDVTNNVTTATQNVANHKGDKNNPHGVTAEQVGAVPRSELTAVQTSVNNHTGNKNNPHNVTASQIGAAPAYSYGTSTLTPGTSPLENGKLYFVYE